MVQLFFCIALPLMIFSCGKKDFPDYLAKEDSIQHQEADGFYKATFRSLNPGKARITATSRSWIKGKQFYINVAMKRAPEKVRYQQYIHTGSVCPGPEHDINRNGIIELHEVYQASGEMLIPLDKFLLSQEKGFEWFPISGRSGTYYYSKAGSIPLMMEDLYLPDPYPTDGLAKLPFGENLNLQQRVIVIYGTSIDPLLPVACGEIDEHYQEFD